MKNKEFSSFKVTTIIILFSLVLLVVFSAGIILLIQEGFSKEGIIGSIFIFALSLVAFFALGLDNIFKKEKEE